MNTIHDENKMRFEIWFETNFLDGDKIQDGQMLSSKQCFEAVMEMRDKTIDECIASIEMMIEENTAGIYFPTIEESVARETITKLTNLKNNG